MIGRGSGATHGTHVVAYVPPPATRVPQLLYEWTDEVGHRQLLLLVEPTPAKVAELLAYTHHRLVAIQSFINGNGRAACLARDLLAYNY